MEMLSNFLNSNFGTTLAVAVVVAVIKTCRPYVIEIMEQTKEYMATKISTSKYKECFMVAEKIWYQVEEDYKVNEEVQKFYKSKAEYFDKLLLKKFPALTEEDINTIRQAISGEQNKNKEENK